LAERNRGAEETNQPEVGEQAKHKGIQGHEPIPADEREDHGKRAIEINSGAAALLHYF
jgi:hypothetical protein